MRDEDMAEFLTRFGLSLTSRGVSPERREALGAAMGGRHHRHVRSIADAIAAKNRRRMKKTLPEFAGYRVTDL
ncbi:hypothetical protein [Burkholderia pseudomultivorans]|uniref:hypothetical protein n=2 Tax=Burkholderia pseudomultivorans TaxID=1207504 RepID=UPI0015840A22|nr:hypothetical protein [Burkholderia pseudomultivorans]